MPSQLLTIEALRLAKELNAELCNAENAYDIGHLPQTQYRTRYLATLRELLSQALVEAGLPYDMANEPKA